MVGADMCLLSMRNTFIHQQWRRQDLQFGGLIPSAKGSRRRDRNADREGNEEGGGIYLPSRLGGLKELVISPRAQTENDFSAFSE